MNRTGYLASLFAFSAFSAFAALAAVPLSACSEKAAPAPTFGDRIVFAMSASLTGANESVGHALVEGTQTAEVLINSMGGVLGKQVHFEIRNDASDRDNILQSAIQDLMHQNPVALMGPGSSVQCENTVDECFNRIPQISAWATSSTLTRINGDSNGAGRWFFRTIPSDYYQARAIFRLAKEGPKKPQPGLAPIVDASAPDTSTPDAASSADAAPPPSDAGGQEPVFCTHPYLIYTDDVIGNPAAAALDPLFAAAGVHLDKLSIPHDYKASYESEIAKVIAAKPNCLILWTYADSGAQVLVDLYAARRGTDPFNGNLFLLGNDGVKTTDLLANTKNDDGTSKAEGIHGCSADPAPDRRDFGTYTRLYQNFVGDPMAQPPAYSANAFDAAVLISLAVQRAGKTDGVAVRDALFALSGNGRVVHVSDLADGLTALRSGIEINYSGASGEVDFDPHGDVIGDFAEWEVSNGQFQTIDRINAAELQ